MSHARAMSLAQKSVSHWACINFVHSGYSENSSSLPKNFVLHCGFFSSPEPKAPGELIV